MLKDERTEPKWTIEQVEDHKSKNPSATAKELAVLSGLKETTVRGILMFPKKKGILNSA